MLAKEILRIIPRSIRIIRRLSSSSLDRSINLQHLRIMLLVKEGQSQTQMADTLQVSLPAISKMINGSALKDLIERTPGKDGRCLCLKLTAQGKKKLNLVLKEVENKIEPAIESLTVTEKKHLEQGLLVLEKVMNQVNEV
jgi:DNA-binding MarR family transcriptional regulator